LAISSEINISLKIINEFITKINFQLSVDEQNKIEDKLKKLGYIQ
jgi:hypothetical protein